MVQLNWFAILVLSPFIRCLFSSAVKPTFFWPTLTNQVLYSCKEAAGNKEQLRRLQNICGHLPVCWIDVKFPYILNKESGVRIDLSRQPWKPGKADCPGTADADMYLWLVYSCDDGGTDKTTTHTPPCDSSTTSTSSPTPLTATPYILKVKKSADFTFQSQKICRKSA